MPKVNRTKSKIRQEINPSGANGKSRKVVPKLRANKPPVARDSQGETMSEEAQRAETEKLLRRHVARYPYTHAKLESLLNVFQYYLTNLTKDPKTFLAKKKATSETGSK